MDLERLSIPFYLNPDSPYRRPVMSHHASAHNLVLKVTVPKRTGRKRKRGSNDPFEGEVEMADADSPHAQVCSQARLDNPKVLRRKLQDNVDRYQVEAVGVVKGVHRFRGMLLWLGRQHKTDRRRVGRLSLEHGRFCVCSKLSRQDHVRRQWVLLLSTSPFPH